MTSQPQFILASSAAPSPSIHSRQLVHPTTPNSFPSSANKTHRTHGRPSDGRFFRRHHPAAHMSFDDTAPPNWSRTSSPAAVLHDDLIIHTWFLHCLAGFVRCPSLGVLIAYLPRPPSDHARSLACFTLFVHCVRSLPLPRRSPSPTPPSLVRSLAHPLAQLTSAPPTQHYSSHYTPTSSTPNSQTTRPAHRCTSQTGSESV
jgi:hypothetical protein